jgi:ketosteroid isomerase-like protein
MATEAGSLRERREACVREHMESENLQDFARTLTTFAHPHYELIGSGDVFDGAERVMRYFRESRAAVPDQRSRLIAIHSADDAVIVEFDLMGTPRAAGGRSFTCRMVALFIFPEGGDRIVCERVYWDTATIARQLAPGPGA